MAGERKAPEVEEATKTIVGVPTLDKKAPAPAPSETLVGSRKPMVEGSDSNTAVDVKALSAAEADRVLKKTGFTQEEIPTAQPRVTIKGDPSPKPPPASGGSPVSSGPRRTSKPPPPLPPGATRPGLAPRGRSTLLLDGEAPKGQPTGSDLDGETEATHERPPIVVPAPNQNAPKAITQSPPWGDGTVQLGKQIPRDALAPKVDPQVEELSDSLLVPDAPPSAQEISSSHILPDDSGALKKVELPAAGKPAPKTSKPPLPPARTSAKPPPLPGKAASIPPPLPGPAAAPVHTAAGSVPTSLAWPAPPPPPQAPLPPPEMPSPAAGAAPLPGAAIPSASAEPPGVVPIPSLPPTADELPLSARGRAMQKARQGLETALARAKPALDVAKTRSKEGLTVAHHHFRELEGMLAALLPPGHGLRQNRPTWLFPAIAGGSIVVSLILWGTMCSVLSPAARPVDAVDRTASGGASGTQARGAAPTAATPATRSPTPAGAVAPCTLAGGQHIVAPNALVASGVEVVATGGGVSLGMATSEKEGLVVSLDPTSLSATATAKVRAPDTIRRVTPLMGGKGLAGIADVDRKADRIEGRRVVAGDPPFDIGGLAGEFVAGPHGSNAAVNLWPLEGDGTVEAARGVRAGEGAEQKFALTFRRGNAIWVGAASGERASDAKGALSRIEGLGDRVGSPAIAVAGDTVLVAWADRASDGAPWGLRYVTYKLGEAPGTPKAFSVPAGGKGEQAMSPGVAALPSGGFLLVWTEGPMSEHDVRAQTLQADGSPVGSPLLVSAEGTNAGQGQAAVTPDGRGVVAFLVANGRTGQVVASPVTCPSGEAP